MKTTLKIFLRKSVRRKIKLKAFYIIAVIITIALDSFGQGNQPQEKMPLEKIKAIFQKNLLRDKIPNRAIEIELNYGIPFKTEIEEKEIFFKNLLYISVDERGHIFAPDSALCVIYEFDNKGKLFNKYQKKGQGPGEFQFPAKVLFFDNQNIVLDGAQRRITIFDKKWKYSRTVSFFLGYIPFAIGSEGKLYCNDPNNEKLIAVLDLTGKCINKMGELPFSNKRESLFNKFIAKISPAGSIWVGFKSSGIIRKYSRLGVLEKEWNIIDLCSEFVKSLRNENYELEKKDVKGNYLIIEDMAFINEDLLVTGGGIVRPIFRFGSDGVLKKAYYVAPRFGFSARCSFAKTDDKGNEIFYMLQRENDEANIGVYGRRK